MTPKRHVLPALLLLLVQRAATCPPPCTCPRPHAVDCRGKALAAVPPDLPPDTIALDLRDNRLADLFGQLPSLPQLQILDLSYNHIKQLGRGSVFAPLEELRSLNLSHNDFRTVFNGVFRGLRQLQSLSMTHGQLRFVEEHAFDGLTELRLLRLSSNQLSALFPEWFLQLPRLEELHLQGNHITYVNVASFTHLGRLRKLLLSGNRIKGINDHAFDGLVNLADLHLEDNHLTKVPSASLRATSNLKILKLGGNSFTWLQTGDFVRLPLEEVSIENAADLTVVERGAFWDLPNLRTLHMHRNSKLRFIDPEAFLNVPNLRILSLHANNLPALSHEALKGFQKRLQISLHDNPLLCDCNVKWLHEILTGNRSKVNVTGADATICDEPPEFHKVPVQNLTAIQIPDMCPPVLVGPRNATAHRKIGDGYIFECRAHGMPAPSVHWILPNGALLNHTSNDLHLMLRSPGALSVSHLRPRDSGPYSCVAENPLGEAISITQLIVSSIDIHLFPLGVASTYVTVVWNGTARNAFPEYEIVYRPDGNHSEPYQSVTVSQFLRSYTIHHLRPSTPYTFCIGVKSREDQQYMQFSCTRVETRDESFMLQGIVHHTSNVAVAAVLGIVTSMTMVVCAVTVAARKYRQRLYDTPEKSLVSNMAPIPMENLHSPLVSRVRS